MANRIELCGRLANPPALRVTPAGTAVLSLVVDCGDQAGALRMPIVMAGEPARALAPRLTAGLIVRATGALRASPPRTRSGLGVEVIADTITLADART